MDQGLTQNVYLMFYNMNVTEYPHTRQNTESVSDLFAPN